MSKARVLGAALAVLASGSFSIGMVGSELIQNSEGYRPAAYRDPIGIVTACYGHTSPHLRMGMTFTRAECDTLFKSDVLKHQKVITPGHRDNCIGNAPLTANQSDAVTSLVFNIGTGNFCKSTMARKLKARDYRGAALEFPKWKYAGGRVLAGLVTRRAREQALYRSTSVWVSYDLRDLSTQGSTTAKDRP